MALEASGNAVQGGTLFVNLEPCNHTGRTPPCTERILQAGIRKVIFGTPDPNPTVDGHGAEILQGCGVEVQQGPLIEQCQVLNEIFFHYVNTKRPFVTLKQAMTLDGKIATRTGESHWLTGPTARHYVHYLRSGYDALLTTAETVMADNPQLTVRNIPEGNQRPVRVVLDRRLRLNPNQYQIFDTQQSPTWLFTSKVHHNESHAVQAKAKGVEVIPVDDTGLGLDLQDVFRILGERQITSVFVEAGGRLAGSLVNQKLVNKLYLFYAPKLLPDPMAKGGLVEGIQLTLQESLALSIQTTKQLDTDWVIEAYPTPA
jgi:diaminohydroxyphosphoribosylaminopyrimidine deaminase / 5-amino-6-(5-phosphoribosylamino)uracil reductase